MSDTHFDLLDTIRKSQLPEREGLVFLHEVLQQDYPNKYADYRELNAVAEKVLEIKALIENDKDLMDQLLIHFVDLNLEEAELGELREIFTNDTDGARSQAIIDYIFQEHAEGKMIWTDWEDFLSGEAVFDGEWFTDA